MRSSTVWDLVVPLKPLRLAKSRLAGAAGDAVRPGLALAFAQDTVAAALACRAVRAVTVVTDDPVAGAELAGLGARIVPDTPAAGLNAALAHGAAAIRRDAPDAAVAALGADLPALRPAELAAVLDAAAAAGRAFLPDAAGIGTTLLAAAAGLALAPAFGGPSRARHRASGAREIRTPGVDSVRRDVDTAEDLAVALGLGVGPRTALAASAAGLAGLARGAKRRGAEGAERQSAEGA
ncbi:2-phospho-L-lactate guanylyltransferase [Streptomyces sp. SL13]|uniref:Phosphoenolpyruvate guanylyltransferase n=1 Tax=Streptantibioticus silvisoli TaxID=2705255 RepID=A0AA90GUZ7_9ACTN|nr:2-phospho-L-lactate guanylyltransferase [Streptantibioticus silvisoli]MDI5968454.1 2-phospho-L-lactate guanylyltransferase [Streptantibioticus silvisoli]